MGKLYCLMGKSSCGKDSIYKKLMHDTGDSFRTVVPYTTRPMRAGEQEGVEYHFCDDKTCASLEAQGKVIELRAYHTVHGIWKYFTADDGQIATDGGNYLYITTLEAYERLRDYYGKEFVVSIYMEVDDGVRLQRALDRERKQKPPKYKEMCRRFLADAEDFSEENLTRAGITERFVNDDLDATARAIWDYMRRIERG